jgi:hypothetical protein
MVRLGMNRAFTFPSAATSQGATMKATGSMIVLMGSVLLLGACARDETPPVAAEDTAATGAPTEQPGTESAADAGPVSAQTWIDDVTIGSELAADGSIAAGKTGDDFAPGQAVNIAMEVGDAPPNTEVKVIWFGPNETKVGEEVKPTLASEKYLNFSAKDTKSWKKGDYRAEVWVGDEKVNQQMFQIVDAGKAAG